MSNLIFPSDIGTGTTGTNQWGFRLPFKKTPSYATLVQTPANRRGENRISLTPYPIWMFDLDLAFMKGDFTLAQATSIFQTMIGFFGQVGGRFQDWLYTDDEDSAVATSNGLVAYGDGSTTQFQLQRQINGLNDIIQNPNWSSAVNIYVNGVLQTVFNGSGSAAVYWLGQENLLLQSEDFNTANWTPTNQGTSNPTVTSDVTTAPDGTATAADQINYPSTVGANKSSSVFQTVSIGTQAVQFTFSVWLKATAGSPTAQISVSDSVTGQGLAKSVVLSSAAWTRFSVTATLDAGSTGSVNVNISSVNQAAFNLYAWGAQLERWSVPTGYLPTSTAQSFPNGVVTFATAPGANLPITWSGNFYFRCRFDEDEWPDLEMFVNQIWSQSAFKFRSVIL